MRRKAQEERKTGRSTTRTGKGREDRCSKPPTRRFANFSPLNIPIDQVLMQNKDEGTLTLSGKLKGDLSKRSRDKYYCFHRDHGHDTFECYNLKLQIEALIRQGKLQRFIEKEKTDPPQEQPVRKENERCKPPIGNIRMVVGAKSLINIPRRHERLTFGWFKMSN